MRRYLSRSNFLMRQLWSSYRWKTNDKRMVYLTFDDGPHPTITPFVLEQLQHYDATATFFCIGNNVVRYPEVYHRIINEGHTTGNHTYDHKNGWKTSTATYVKSVIKASQNIVSKLFRPPYGRIKNKQAQLLKQRGYNIVMWSLLTGDFDVTLSAEECLQNTIESLKEGDIVVFHDSEKAWERLRYVLPLFLAHCHQKGWVVRGL
jgi:peptidoglycan/xylan/chitin deacetylase (PgdA/CDA1 family)